MTSYEELGAIAGAAFGRAPASAQEAVPVRSLDEAMDIIAAGPFGRVTSGRVQEARDFVQEASGAKESKPAPHGTQVESPAVAEAREAVVQAQMAYDRRVIHGADEAMRRRLAEGVARVVVEGLTSWAMRDAWTEDELVARIRERAAQIREGDRRTGPPKRTLPPRESSGAPAPRTATPGVVTEAELDEIAARAFGGR